MITELFLTLVTDRYNFNNNYSENKTLGENVLLPIEVLLEQISMSALVP